MNVSCFVLALAAFEFFIFWFSEVSYAVPRYRFLFIYPVWDFYCELLIFPGKKYLWFFFEAQEENTLLQEDIPLVFFPAHTSGYCSLVTEFILWGFGPPYWGDFGLQICVWFRLSLQSFRNPLFSSVSGRQISLSFGNEGVDWVYFSCSLFFWAWNFWMGGSQLYGERVSC